MEVGAVTARRRDPKDKEARLVRAALEIFSEQGYAGTSIHEICHRAGVSIGVFYEHFKGKADLIAKEATPERAFSLTPEDLIDSERLRSAVAQFLNGSQGRIWRAWRDAVLEEPSLRQQDDQLISGVRTRLAATVTEARRRSGLATSDTEAMNFVWVLTALMRDSLHTSWGRPDPVDEVIARAASTFIFGRDR